jgi:polysaccharide biosynthesis protein PslH
MKILFLTNKPPYPPVDGGSIATFGMMKALTNAGHSITALVMNTAKHHISPYQIPEGVSSKIVFHLIEVPAKIKPLPALRNLLLSKLPYNAERFIDKHYQSQLKALLNTNTYDVVQLEGLYLCPYIDTIRLYSKAKIAYRSHNIEHEIWDRLLANARGLKKLYLKIMVQRLKAFETKAMNAYDLLVPITLRDLDHLNKLGNHKPALEIPAGIEIPSIPGNANINNNDLFFIGALDWAPNQEGLLWFIDRVWPIINDQLPSTTLTIAGRNAPEWLVRKLNVKNLVYVGEVPDAAEFMHQHGVMIVPLLSGSGMRVKIIEAMSHRKPIVSTSIGYEGIDLTPGIHLMSGDSPDTFAFGTIQLINNNHLAAAISDDCFTFVSTNYSNEQLAKQLVSFYHKHIV